uniref:Uncharacterized protein n=1 Tax=Arundo donax TaxID=35708 RepID=A0A0A9HUW6_ARUDO
MSPRYRVPCCAATSPRARLLRAAGPRARLPRAFTPVLKLVVIARPLRPSSRLPAMLLTPSKDGNG